MTNTPNPVIGTFARLAEKAAWTAAQVFVAAWLASGSLGFDLTQQAVASALAAAGTVIANGSPASVSPNFGVDLLYRVLRTYAVSFVALWAAAPVLSTDALSTAAWAALPAALTVIKGVAASRIGADTPALLPARLDVPPAVRMEWPSDWPTP